MTTAPSPAARRSWWPFARHYLEMIAAMLVGMALFDAALRGLLALAGTSFPDGYPTLTALKMTFDMSAGMLIWMRIRGHAWPATLEMTASMIVPVAALLPLLWLDVISADTLMLLEHVLMLPLMLVVMLRRRAEYGGPGCAAHV
ncbi:hypothetical protein HII36_43650 [Nonomuraea sp. NN258]|uniref:hypothetical protein n=1 Tax=Nonomuraea antri TaxID=2730852 RepID=UPI00156855BD|nr:hypothetical protein [Nonomuraea antri]NRQ38674.1 hypothetical protein [Nonomuraea antri]